MISDRKSSLFLLSFFGTLVALAFALPSFPQDPKYHEFAVDRDHFGIPNFWNVVSNIPFLIVAILAWMQKERVPGPTAEVFRVGVFLTGIGSAYYHWNPSNATLFWDRLPMTIAFSGVVASLIEGRVNQKWGRLSLCPLVIASAGTVVYWRATDGAGQGNLIPYGIVQFGTLLLVLLILWLFPRKGAEQSFLWLALAAYVAAKLLEGFDSHIANLLGVMGGHPIKHVAAAIGCWYLSRALFDCRARAEPLSSAHEPN